jgi:outer membrane lipoprotein-sorting protein
MSNNTHSISRISDAVCAAALVGGLIVAAGCSTEQALKSRPTLSQEPALTSLEDRDRLLTSLETPAIMDYSGPSGHIKVREQLTVRRPASLRVDAMSPLGVALIVAADDAQIAVFNPSENTLIRGPASTETLERFTRIPMLPAQAVRLLLGLTPDSSVLQGAPSSSRTEDEMKIFSYGRGYELGFSAGQLALVRKRDIAGRVVYEVHYSDYRDIGAMNFPLELEARFVTDATTIRLRYLNPSIDRRIADSTFVLSPGPATRLLEIGLGAPSSPPISPG